jgi:hypothetical protein
VSPAKAGADPLDGREVIEMIFALSHLSLPAHREVLSAICDALTMPEVDSENAV